jgi:predicted esterase
MAALQVSLRRGIRAIVAMGVVTLVAWRFVPRPSSLPLVMQVDGPPPAVADGVIVFLHGKSGDLRTAERMAKTLREVGLSATISIVLFEGPYHTWFGGHQWGDTDAQQANSRDRLRKQLAELLGDRGPPRERVVVAGFSQGAGAAIDMAVEEPRIGALASFSPCHSFLRGEVTKRDLRVLLAHGAADTVCPVEESRSLARALQQAHESVRYIEFDGPHTISMDAVRALARLATPGASQSPIQ